MGAVSPPEQFQELGEEQRVTREMVWTERIQTGGTGSTEADWGVPALSRAKVLGGCFTALPWALDISQHHLCMDKALPDFLGGREKRAAPCVQLLCCLDSSPVTEILILHPTWFSCCNTRLWVVTVTMPFLGREGKSERKPLSTLPCEFLK